MDIGSLYRQFDPLEALPADATDLYVDWQKEMLGPDDVKPRLANSIARSGSVAVTRLFTGHRGTGKTTELYRVQKRLQDGNPGPEPKRIFVSFLECEKWIDLNDITHTDLLLQMVRQIVEDLKAAGYSFTFQKWDSFFGELNELLNKDADLKDLKLKAGPLELGTAIKDVPGARRALRKMIEDRLPRLYDLVNNEIIKPARTWLAGPNHGGYNDILLIVD